MSGSGTDAGATSPNGNTYVYFNTTDITSVSFTYNGTANVTLVVLNDITFMGKTTNPAGGRPRAASSATETAGDAFATQAYTGATGTIPWTGNWVETDATAGAAPARARCGSSTRRRPAPNYGLRLNNSGTAGQFTGAAREIDLSGFVASTMTYSFVTSAGLTTADSVARRSVVERRRQLDAAQDLHRQLGLGGELHERFGQPVGLRVESTR